MHTQNTTADAITDGAGRRCVIEGELAFVDGVAYLDDLYLAEELADALGLSVRTGVVRHATIAVTRSGADGRTG